MRIKNIIYAACAAVSAEALVAQFVSGLALTVIWNIGLYTKNQIIKTVKPKRKRRLFR